MFTYIMICKEYHPKRRLDFTPQLVLRNYPLNGTQLLGLQYKYRPQKKKLSTLKSSLETVEHESPWFLTHLKKRS